MSKLIEEWKDIEGFEGLYQISDWGRVRSCEKFIENKKGIYKGRKIHYKSRILKQMKGKGGYYRVHLCKNGKYYWRLVNRLVWKTFIGEIPEGIQVNHIDEDKSNNVICNLNLLSPKDNSNWGTRNERISKTQLNDEIKSKPINVYSIKTGELLYWFPSIAEAKRVIKVNNVQKVIQGIYKQEKGYTFSYA